MAEMVGGCGVVVATANDELAVPPLRFVTVSVMVVEPTTLETRISVTVRLPLPPDSRILLFGTKLVFEEIPPTVSRPAKVKLSDTWKLRGPTVLPGATPVWSATFVIVGGGPCTRSVNVACEKPPDAFVTFTVIVDVPVWPAAGEMIKYRFAPVVVN